MEMEVDIAITLMGIDSIMELKDGIWQNFELNKVAKTSHFFFYPHNKENDVNLIYKTDDQTIRLSYRVFNADLEHIDPSEWPYPSRQISADQSAKINAFKPANHFSISHSELKECWRGCVVLLSLIELEVTQV